MQSQQKSNNFLLGIYGKLVTFCVVLGLLAILAFRYFSVVEHTASSNLQIEQTRLINVLAMAHSQWLIQGRPNEPQLWIT